MKKFVLASALFAVALSAFASDDKLMKFLGDNQMSNVPYLDQGKAEPGGYVVYDTRKPHVRPSWFHPVNAKTEIDPLRDTGRSDIHIPSDTLKSLKDGTLELSLFGFHPFGQIQSTGTLEYGQIDMNVSALQDDNSFYDHLLAPGTPLTTHVLSYGSPSGSPRVWGNQHVYLILSVYSTDAIKIKSTNGKIVGLSSGDKIAKCPDIDGVAPKDDATGKTETSTTTANGGSFQYCQRGEDTVELHSKTGKPIQLAAQLLRITPDGAANWSLDQQVVVFQPKKTIEQ